MVIEMPPIVKCFTVVGRIGKHLKASKAIPFLSDSHSSPPLLDSTSHFRQRVYRRAENKDVSVNYSFRITFHSPLARKIG